jgi:hypothetical protein
MYTETDYVLEFSSSDAIPLRDGIAGIIPKPKLVWYT